MKQKGREVGKGARASRVMVVDEIRKGAGRRRKTKQNKKPKKKQNKGGTRK